jgi:hypothetical protein
MVALAVAAGCSSGSRVPGTPTPVPAGDSSQSLGVVASATGGAHRVRPLPDGELFVLSFTAQKRADGSATGYAHVDRKDLDIAFDIDVTCLAVVDNVAWVGGIIRNERGGVARNGAVSYFYVIDNGEGDGGVPDRASAIRVNDVDGEDLVFCTERPLVLPATDIELGNLQVR